MTMQWNSGQQPYGGALTITYASGMPIHESPHVKGIVLIGGTIWTDDAFLLRTRIDVRGAVHRIVREWGERLLARWSA